MGQTCSSPPGPPEDVCLDGDRNASVDAIHHTLIARMAHWSPDTVGPEALEWANRALELLWPEMDKVAKTIAENKITPRMQDVAGQKTSKLKDMRFSAFTLGKAAPKLSGLHVSSTPFGGAKIRMMLEYVSDMEVELLAMKMKIGSKAFRLFGELAVILRPTMEDYPGKVSGISMYFVNKPKMEIEFTGLAEVTEFVGLNKIVRNVMGDMLAEKLVLPNAVTMVVGYDDITVFPPVMGPPHPPIGALRVRLLKAEGIRSGDINWNPLVKAVDDNYVRFTIGDRSWKAPTAKLPQEHTFTVHDLMQNLAIEVWDEDKYTADDFLGTAGEHTMAEAQALSGKTVQVHDPSCKEGEGGTLQMEVTWFDTKPFKLGPEENLIVLQVQEVLIYSRDVSGKIAVRARVAGEERMTRATAPMTSAVKEKTVTSVMEDMKERLRKEGLQEEAIERLTSREGLRSGSKTRVAVHANLSFAIDTCDMEKSAIEIEIVQVLPKKQEFVLGTHRHDLKVFLETPDREVGGEEGEKFIIDSEKGKIELSSSIFCCALETGSPPDGGKLHLVPPSKSPSNAKIEDAAHGTAAAEDDSSPQTAKSSGKWKFGLFNSSSSRKSS